MKLTLIIISTTRLSFLFTYTLYANEACTYNCNRGARGKPLPAYIVHNCKRFAKRAWKCDYKFDGE